jgi:hypothetical protein
MSVSSSEYLDLRKAQNYVAYFIGIGIESAAVALLMLAGLCIAVLAVWFF